MIHSLQARISHSSVEYLSSSYYNARNCSKFWAAAKNLVNKDLTLREHLYQGKGFISRCTKKYKMSWDKERKVRVRVWRARASGRYFLRCVLRVLSMEVTGIWRLKGEPKARLRSSGHCAKESFIEKHKWKYKDKQEGTTIHGSRQEMTMA